MPNGYYGSIEDWQRTEAPLLEIDDVLSQFAAERKVQLVKNYHNWPRRELEWVSDGIHRAIHIFAADKPERYHLAVVASKDKYNERYIADKWLKKWVVWSEIRDNLHQLLEESFRTLEAWSERDLKPS